MKMTLLEMVIDILNDMDADEVDDINDTVESRQVAQIIKTCFFEMISNRNWPHLKKLIQLEASNNLTRPTHMKVPEGVKQVESIKYNKQKLSDPRIRYETVYYKEPEEFLELSHNLDSTADNVLHVVDMDGTDILVYNDRAPTFWTSFDDEWLVFDAFDLSVESTLKKANSQVFAYVEPSWSVTNDFVPDLPEEAFSALLAEAKSTSFYSLKQMTNEKAEQKAGRQQRWLARKAWKAHGGIKYPDFGRRSRK